MAVQNPSNVGPELAKDVKLLAIPHLIRRIRPWSDVLAFVETYRLCRKWRFDVVHTHNAKDGVLGRWAAHLAGVPVLVHTIHNISFRASRRPSINKVYAVLERFTASVTNAFLGVSRENVRDYLKRGIGTESQYRIVYSGLELDRYKVSMTKEESRQMLGLPSNTRVVGWVGRLNYQKDPITFVRAARLIADRLPNIRFVVCGDDPLAEDLAKTVHRLVDELSLADHLVFLGFRSDLPDVFQAVDCVMHSSRYEGMSRTVCEALLCHKPVAATAVDGVREVIIPGQRGGFLAPSEDPAALAEATLTLLNDPERARSLAESGRAWVEQNLSAGRMVEEIANVYSQLFHGGETTPFQT